MKKASVTVETALVLPIFIFLSMHLFSIFEMMTVYSGMQSALQETAVEVAAVLYVNQDSEISREDSFLITETFVREEVMRKVGVERINDSVIEGGVMGISLLRSDIAANGKDVELILTYRVKPWFAYKGVGNMTLVNHCKVRAWTGYEGEGGEIAKDEEKEETVYVTETGSAYHLYRDCSYLVADSHSVSGAELAGIRNESGAIYYPCEICSKGNKATDTETYYVSTWGSRYHTDPACRALLKNVKAIPKSETGSRHLCSKCAARSGN